MFPRFYNNNALIVQSPGYVTILLEEIHEARIIPLDTRPPLSENIRQWNRDPRGRWEGDSLVVETRNLDHRVSALQPWSDFDSRSGSGGRLTLVERFKRVDADTIEYQVRVDDPQMYTRPWTVAYPFVRTDELLYEYCIAPGFLDSGLTVFASTLPRPARRGRVVPERGFGSRTSPASSARCMSA